MVAARQGPRERPQVVARHADPTEAPDLASVQIRASAVVERWRHFCAVVGLTP
jgi:hypothetical protein